MKRDEAIALVQAHRAQLQALGVKSLDLFGSVARDEARDDSDVDFLVEFDQPGGLFQLFRVRHSLEDLLGCKVDLGTTKALRERVHEPVMKDLRHVI